MIVGYGEGGVLLLGLVEGDVETLHKDLTLTYNPPPGTNFLTGEIIVVYAKTKIELIEQLDRAGVNFSDEMRRKYLAGERTDRPRKPF